MLGLDPAHTALETKVGSEDVLRIPSTCSARIPHEMPRVSHRLHGIRNIGALIVRIGFPGAIIL